MFRKKLIHKLKDWKNLPWSSLGCPALSVESHNLTDEIVLDGESRLVVAKDCPVLKMISLRSPDDKHLVLARV